MLKNLTALNLLSVTSQEELFFVVGKEALIENRDWYLIFKEKEPEIKGI